MVPVTGVILAGGQSRRMGRDKALIELGGKTLLERTADTLWHITSDLIVVGPEERGGQLPGVTVVQDAVPGSGPLGGIAAALRASPHPCCLVVACDMPLLNVGLLRYLVELAPSFDVVIPDADGFTHQMHAVYSTACLPHMERQLAAGDFKIDRFFPRVRVRYVTAEEIDRFDPQHRSLLNVNTPEELAEAETLLDALMHRDTLSF